MNVICFLYAFSSNLLNLVVIMCMFYLVLLAEGNAPSVVNATAAAVNVKPPKATKAPTVAASEKKGGGGSERPIEKERKKEVPPPRMQYDDTSRVEKAKRRSVVKQTEARNRVELFRHLPQYEHGTQLPDLESRFFQLDPVHPAVYKVFTRLYQLVRAFC